MSDFSDTEAAEYLYQIDQVTKQRDLLRELVRAMEPHLTTQGRAAVVELKHRHIDEIEAEFRRAMQGDPE